MNKNICVFCASRQGDNLNTIAKAGDLGRAIADSGYGLIFGGGRLGLMGTIASSAIEANGHVIGIIPKGLTAREPVQQELKELQFEYKTIKSELMRRSRATEVENAMAPYGLVVAKEMPIRIQIENKIKTPLKK